MSYPADVLSAAGTGAALGQPDLGFSERDHVARAQLGAPPGLDRAVDRDASLGQQRADLATGVDEVGQLQQLPEPDAGRTHGDLLHVLIIAEVADAA